MDMDSNYQLVLQRLRKERERQMLTQQRLCCYMKMQQSHFSKAETGHRRFSYQEIKRLCATDIDVYYIFTGKTTVNRHIFSDPAEAAPEEILCYLYTVYVLANAAWFAGRNRISFEKIQKELEYIRCENRDSEIKPNIFYYTRMQYGYTQQKMADILGVDIKKLRELEKGKQLPDSELIWKMYDLFQISPAFILKDTKGLWNELNCALDLMENSDREIVLRILENSHKLLFQR